MGLITVFGGTFNPIHIGHVEIINKLSSMSCVDKVIIIPTKIPPHKEIDFLADSKHRFNMCNIIADDFDNVIVSDIELSRVGKSYTIDTVEELQKIYSSERLALTVGGDMLVSFDKWKEYESILNKCVLITFNRDGIDTQTYSDAIDKLKSVGAEIIEIEDTISSVSSTQIRDSFKNNDVSKLLDKRIYNYIVDNKLFGV